MAREKISLTINTNSDGHSDGRSDDRIDSSERQGIQSIEVGVPLLQALADNGGPMMLRDIAKAAGMPAAKAHRYLVSFIRVNLVTQDAHSGRYDLGRFALNLGLASLARLDSVRVATPILEALNQEIGETVALSVWGNMGPTFVRWIESRRPVSVNLRTGDVMPLLHSASGLCFAVFLDTPTLKIRIREELAVVAKAAAKVAAKATAKSPQQPVRPPSTIAEFDAIAKEARAAGLTRTLGAVIPNVNAFSAPVFDHDGKMVLAMTTLGPAGLFDSEWNSPLAASLLKAARQASTQLGWKG
jgi:DNA-binding IclR family transcriptional regulator